MCKSYINSVPSCMLISFPCNILLKRGDRNSILSLVKLLLSPERHIIIIIIYFLYKRLIFGSGDSGWWLVPSFHDKKRNTTYSPRILMIHINHLLVEAPHGAIWHILTKPFAWWASSVQVFIDQWIYKPINEANSMKQQLGSSHSHHL